VGRARPILFTIRAVLTGWAVLLLLGYAAERPLLWLLQKTVGGQWTQPSSILADFLCFFTAGWVTGRLHRPYERRSVLAFLISLLFFDLEPILPLHFGWVLREISNTIGDSRYLEGLVQAAISNGMYLAAVWAGGTQSRRTESLSIVSPRRTK
jgi:hypothetical protein